MNTETMVKLQRNSLNKFTQSRSFLYLLFYIKDNTLNVCSTDLNKSLAKISSISLSNFFFFFIFIFPSYIPATGVPCDWCDWCACTVNQLLFLCMSEWQAHFEEAAVQLSATKSEENLFSSYYFLLLLFYHQH